eukprot:2351268-Alexandrium_andersonii.AAC.1
MLLTYHILHKLKFTSYRTVLERKRAQGTAGGARAASQPLAPRGGDVVPSTPRPASAESAMGGSCEELDELASRM